MRNFSIKDTRLKNKTEELDKIIGRILREDTMFILSGKKKEIEAFCEKHEIAAKVKAVIMKESQELEKEISRYPANETDIIINVSYERAEYEQSRQLWETGGYTENDNFFQGEVFGIIWDVYHSNRICLDRVEVFVTSYCTLNCEKCINYMPYFKEKAHVPLKELTEDADLLFGKVDYVYKLKILGGEGLLYPNLIEYITYVRRNYGSKAGSIRIGTNGTIIPKPSILEACRENGVILDISDYAAAVPDKSKLDQLIKACQDYGVGIDIKRTGEHWLDLGFPDKKADFVEEGAAREHFYKCAMFCRQFADGKYWFCCSNFAAVKCGLFPENSNDYFDFRKTFSKKELLAFELGYTSLGHTTFCTVCQGCSDEANRNQIEVAKQKEYDKD